MGRFPPALFTIQSTTIAAVFPPSSIKEIQNINLTPAKTGGSVFYRNYHQNRLYSTGGRRRREPERGRGARVTGLRPYPCFCDDRQDRPAGKGMESGVCQADRRERNAQQFNISLINLILHIGFNHISISFVCSPNSIIRSKWARPKNMAIMQDWPVLL